MIIARDEAEADSINRAGFSAVAVSSVGVWEPVYAERFRALDVVLIADPGSAGSAYIATIKADLRLLASSLRALPLTAEQAAGLSGDALQAILDEADDLLRPWPKPVCSLKSFERIPRFDPQLMLPASLRQYLVDQADEMQVPISALAASALSGLSILIGRKVVVQPKRSNPSFRIAAPLWCMIVADSGQKKSQILKTGLSPLLEIDNRLAAFNKSIATENSVKMKALLAREKRLEGIFAKGRKNSSNSDDDPILEELLNIEKMKAQIAESGAKQYIVREATAEKLLELLVRNPNGLLQIADEVPGWWRSLST